MSAKPRAPASWVSSVAFLIFALCACAASPPAQTPPPTPPAPSTECGSEWTTVVENVGVSVAVCPAPFMFVVRDAAGVPTLSSAGLGGGSGFGAVGWSEGSIDLSANTLFHHLLKPTGERQHFEGWKDDFEVVSGVVGTGDAATLELGPRGGPAEVRMTLTAQPRVVRVELERLGGAPRFWQASFVTDPLEGFLGFGERFTRTNLRGLDVYAWAEEGGFGAGEGVPPGPTNPASNGEAMTYYPVPFFISTAGYGFWLDSTWYNEFNLATQVPNRWRVWHIGPSLAFEVYVPNPADPRPWPYHLIDAFTERTGRPMMPPEWAYGPRRRVSRGDQICPDFARSCPPEDRVSEIRAHRDMDLPLTAVDDAFHLLPRGQNIGAAGSRKAWTAELAELGYAANAYVNPYLSDDPSDPIGARVAHGLESGYFLRDAAGATLRNIVFSAGLAWVYQIDFTDPRQTAWYGELLDAGLEEGYGGFMVDFGEYVQQRAVGSDGRSGEELHNVYPLLYQRAVHEHFESGPLRGDWLGFVRSGYTGSSAYAPLAWSGDPNASFGPADGLPSMIPAGLNLGISGVPNWGGDIGGFHCLVPFGRNPADDELLTRWIQLGAMTPNMQDQDACLSWTGSKGRKSSIFTSRQAADAWRKYAGLHTRMQPYLVTLGHTASATGAPILRHVFLEHPDRPDLAGTKNAFYLGPSLFVAPVVERGARTVSIEFPQGRYLRWGSGVAQVYPAGKVTVEAPIGEIPLFLRDGHLLPLLDPSIDTLFRETNPEVVGPDDVADVYDVVGFISPETGRAAFAFWDGRTLEATWAGCPIEFALPEARDEDDLRTCGGCWLVEDLGAGLVRARISAPDGEVRAGGLVLDSRVGRRIRWDLTLEGTALRQTDMAPP